MKNMNISGFTNIKDEVIMIVENSNPSCGLRMECYTECGECGAERIKDVMLDWLEKHVGDDKVKLFLEEWNSVKVEAE